MYTYGPFSFLNSTADHDSQCKGSHFLTPFTFTALLKERVPFDLTTLHVLNKYKFLEMTYSELIKKPVWDDLNFGKWLLSCWKEPSQDGTGL